MTSSTSRMPVIYLSHGGGPCFFMDWSPADTWTKTADWLKGLHRTFPVPKAVVVISAHWEEKVITIQSGARPSLIYDYYGFPKHTYELQYPAPGSPELAAKIKTLLDQAGIEAEMDANRGFDHGVFIPFKLIYPEADIPILQLSLRRDLNPRYHIKVGQALQSLRNEGILIVGSGMSYHNLRDLFNGANVLEISREFDQWLKAAVSARPDERDAALEKWSSAPSARRAHPREEHLLPLMVIAGAAGEDRGFCVFNDEPMGASSSAFQFG